VTPRIKAKRYNLKVKAPGVPKLMTYKDMPKLMDQLLVLIVDEGTFLIAIHACSQRLLPSSPGQGIPEPSILSFSSLT
jgi:hypothetical protein